MYDNNSTDDTFEVARQYGAVVRREMLQGKGNVIRRMFADIDADVYVMVDGDATYDAPSAPAMVEKLLSEQMDMVVGCRKDQCQEAYRAGHRLGNLFFTKAVEFLFGQAFTDILSAIVHSPAALSKVSLRRQAGLKQRQSLLSTAYKCGYVPEK